MTDSSFNATITAMFGFQLSTEDRMSHNFIQYVCRAFYNPGQKSLEPLVRIGTIFTILLID